MIANQETTVPVEKTIGEIQGMLVASKATSIMTKFEDQRASALMFQIQVNGQTLSYSLPCNWRGTLKAMERERKVTKKFLCEDQARRVGWRIVRDWLRAQLSLIEAGQSTLPEVMLPWMLINERETVAHKILGGDGLLRLTQSNQAEATS